MFPLAYFTASCLPSSDTSAQSCTDAKVRCPERDTTCVTHVHELWFALWHCVRAGRA